MKSTRQELTETSSDEQSPLGEPIKSATSPASRGFGKLYKVLSQLKQIGGFFVKRPALVTSLAVTGLVVLGRQIEILEPLELNAYDRMVQLRPGLPPDPRILVVEVTEADIRSLGYPISDGLIARALQNLEQYKPAAIGLDILRDVPIGSGNAELLSQFKKSDRIIPICQISVTNNSGTLPPPGVPEAQVGFADLGFDEGGIIRRALLFHDFKAASGCTTQFSFAFQLAWRYLKTKGIEPENIVQDKQQQIKLGHSIFKPLLPNSGGYQKADAGGYQILLNYRGSDKLSDSVTISDVLNNRIDPKLVKNRVVLIGVTAPSEKDTFYTPYSTKGQQIQRMPGVVIHGEIVSQILSTVLDGRRLFWFWPEWGEVLWIWVWSLAGGILVRVVRHPGQLVVLETLALGILAGTSIALFFGSGWLPVAAPSLGLILGGTGVLAYTAYQTQQEGVEFARLVSERDNNIIALQALLKQTTNELETSNQLQITNELETSNQLQTRNELETTNGLATTPENSSLLDETLIFDNDETAIAPDADSTAVWDTEKVVEPVTTSVSKSSNPNILGGRYKINRILGSGGFGLTYLAEDIQRPGKPKCVIKQLKPARQDEKFLSIARRLFKTEAEILEKLGTHPQIPLLLAYFEEEREFYLVEEYVKGDSISDELPVDKRLPEKEVVQLLKDILEVLLFIHKNSVIHRDIKPSNIIRREEDGKIFLIDFGAVKEIQPQDLNNQENATVAVGTRGYSPPEQYAGHPSFSSDIYAVGMIGVQAVTGIAPHQLSITQETGDVSWRHLANVSDEFGKILENMVRYHFPDRYQSITAVMKDLESLRPK